MTQRILRAVGAMALKTEAGLRRCDTMLRRWGRKTSQQEQAAAELLGESELFNLGAGNLPQGGRARLRSWRSHPGGQWVKKSHRSPEERHGQQQSDLQGGSFSLRPRRLPPSSILIDMVLADVQAAVWLGSVGVVDAGNSRGLTQMSSLSDGLDFSREATAHPGRFLEGQKIFLEQQKMPLDAVDVYRRNAALFLAAAQRANEPLQRAGAAAP